MIDNLRSTGKDGKVKETPLAKEQLEHITQLVKDAVGYDESRGDSVNVVNASFTQETTPAPAEGELESREDLGIARCSSTSPRSWAGWSCCWFSCCRCIRPLVKNLIGPAPSRCPVAVLPPQPRQPLA